jgi:hypothetical protein
MEGKMKLTRYKIFAMSAALVILSAATSSASTLYDWAFNADGTLSTQADADPMPTAGALDGNGLGTLTWTTTGAGDHYFYSFFDFEITESDNGWDNETGSEHGIAAAGQSWEIDHPVVGWIYDDVLNGDLAIYTGNYIGGEVTDVSFAMGWDFTLGDGQTALITLSLSDAMPQSGFYLQHFDNDNSQSVFLSSTLAITGDGGPQNPVPEPATMLLLVTGLAGLAGFRRKHNS